MFKTFIIAASILALPITAMADPFNGRLEQPMAGDVMFPCQTDGMSHMSYYFHPTSGERITRYWLANLISYDPYQVEYLELDAKKYRAKCGVSKQESQWMRQLRYNQVKPSIPTTHQPARINPGIDASKRIGG